MSMTLSTSHEVFNLPSSNDLRSCEDLTLSGFLRGLEDKFGGCDLLFVSLCDFLFIEPLNVGKDA